MIAEMTGQGEMTLPPEALKALGGAGFVTAEKDRVAGVLLKPANADTPGAASVTGAGALTLPPAALEIMRDWPAWNGVIGWDGRNVDVMINEENAGLILFFPPGPGSLALRRRTAELGWTDDDINTFMDEVKQERHRRFKAERQERVEQRKHAAG